MFSDPVRPTNQSIWLGGNLKLSCPLPSNLAQTSWKMDNSQLTPSARLQLLQDGLLILNASYTDAGRYRCLSVENSNSVNYTTVVAEYDVRIVITGSGRDLTVLPQAQKDGPSVIVLQAVVGLLVVSLLALLAWNFYKGHLPLLWKCGQKNREQTQRTHENVGLNSAAQGSGPAEDKLLVSGTGNSNNNHNTGEAAFSAAENDAPYVNIPSLKYIDDSDI